MVNNSLKNMLEYIGCEPVEVAYSMLYYWTFVQDLANGYEKYRGLTDKQYAALCKIVTTKTNCTVKPKDWQKARRTGRDNMEAGHRVNVVHKYATLICIPLYALPFKSGEKVEVHLEPYSEDKMVCIIKGAPYLIHKPAKWEKIKEKTVKVCTYTRTTHKGFLIE